jgi:hypothetical protein
LPPNARSRIVAVEDGRMMRGAKMQVPEHVTGGKAGDE